MLPTYAAVQHLRGFKHAVYFSTFSVIDFDILQKECDEIEFPRQNVFIPKACPYVSGAHKDRDKAVVNAVSGTGMGVGPARAEFIMRTQEKRSGEIADKYGFSIWGGTSDEIGGQMFPPQNLVVEQCQGFLLGLQHGDKYPYCTSKNTSILSLLSGFGLSLLDVRNRDIEVHAVFRTFPIRVGNAPDSWSGPVPSEELTWEQLSEEVGKTIEPQLTTVTKRPRRVFRLSTEETELAMRALHPKHIALTHCDWAGGFKNTIETIGRYLMQCANKYRPEWDAHVSFASWGEDVGSEALIYNPLKLIAQNPPVK
jgi:adenylosuccinate synthase